MGAITEVVCIIWCNFIAMVIKRRGFCAIGTNVTATQKKSSNWPPHQHHGHQFIHHQFLCPLLTPQIGIELLMRFKNRLWFCQSCFLYLLVFSPPWWSHFAPIILTPYVYTPSNNIPVLKVQTCDSLSIFAQLIPLFLLSLFNFITFPSNYPHRTYILTNTTT